MRKTLSTAALLASSALTAAAQAEWKTQEIGRDLGVVYAVNVADMNRDGKTDIVAINGTQVMWFENPTWKKHVVLEGVTKKDNVCFATEDIDGDGWLDMALGADWQPTNTAGGGSLQWIGRKDKNDKNPDAPWELHPISDEPTLHRIRWGDVDGDGKNELVVVPLHGRETKKPDWDGKGTRILVFHKPKDPANDPWPVEIASDKLHIAHNFFVDKGTIYVASKEGVTALARDKKGLWSETHLGDGKPGEIKPGKVGGARTLATVEPWHGTSLVLFRDPGGKPGAQPWTRDVLDEGLKEGHAIGWGDFDRDGQEELIAGWRGKPYGVAMYKRTGGDGKWEKSPVDDGMATEDLIVTDLDKDGRPEIVAGGRATSNIRIYSFTPVAAPGTAKK